MEIAFRDIQRFWFTIHQANSFTTWNITSRKIHSCPELMIKRD